MSRLIYLGVLLLFARYSLAEEIEPWNDDWVFENLIVTLNDSNFDRRVMESDDVWIVIFYATWCPYCLNVEHHLQQAAMELKGKVSFGSIDATRNPIKARENRIDYYPTIKYYPYGLKDLDLSSEYLGDTHYEEIVKWIVKMNHGSNPLIDFSTLFEKNDKNRVKRDHLHPKLFNPKEFCWKHNKPRNEF